MVMTEQAIRLLRERYVTKGENVENVYPRVAKAISKHSSNTANGFRPLEIEFLEMMNNGDFLPNSPCIRNAGYSNMNKACFVLPIEDSIHGIYKALLESAQIFKMGGGVGYNFSDLREEGAPLSAGGTSSGALSFMNMFNASTEAVKQGGFRRGASMGVLDYDHPEIINFIQEKGKHGRLNNFNVSVLVDNDFMKKVQNNDIIHLKSRQDKRKTIQDIKAQDLFNLISIYAWENGDPGILFLNRINQDNPFAPDQMIRATNPCVVGSTLIATADGRNAVRIDELAKMGENVLLYSRNKETGRVEIKMGRTPRKTGTNRLVLKITFTDGSYVEVTPDHKMMMTNMMFYEAKDLRVGDRLMPFNSFNNNGYRQIADCGAEMQGGRFRNRRQYRLIHEHYYGPTDPKKHHIHHADFCKVNDNIDNLLLLTIDEHKELHKKKMIGLNNPYHRMDEDWKFKFASHPGETNPKYINISNDELIYHGQKLMDTDEELTRKNWIRYAKENNLPQNIWSSFRFGRWSNFKSIVTNNHEIASIEVSGYQDVYNITVDDNNTYCIITKYEDDKYISSSGITVHNCGEVPLFPYESCCLGSINLSNCVTSDGDLDKARLKDLIHLGTLFLIGMNKSCQFAIKECYTAQERYFRIGLGVMGYADMLMKMHIMYDSSEALRTIDVIGRLLKDANKYSPISIATRSIAPTGSLSILANCSSGIEPIFSSDYERHTVAGIFTESREDNEYLRTAHDISPDWHLKTLARWQEWIDNGVSKTINMPYESSQSDVSDIYIKAWEMGCKGVTVFRDNCRRGEQVYRRKAKCEGESCTL